MRGRGLDLGGSISLKKRKDSWDVTLVPIPSFDEPRDTERPSMYLGCWLPGPCQLAILRASGMPGTLPQDASGSSVKLHRRLTQFPLLTP
jgi:hypothetical protein